MPTAFKLQPLSLAQANPSEILECWQTLWNLNEVNAFCTVKIHNRIQMCLKYYRVGFLTGSHGWWRNVAMDHFCQQFEIRDIIWCIWAFLGRGVRSGAQLSCTETRFQKCSQVKMFLNTQCYLYLWLTMWFHAKKSKETLKKSKSLILLCKFGSRAQKWPKIAKKTDHSIAIYSIFCIGMVYFGCLQVNPHIQAVQNMCSKGG